MGSTHVYDMNAATSATGLVSGATSVAASGRIEGVGEMSNPRSDGMLAVAEGVAISLDDPEDVGRLEANQDLLAQKLAGARKPSNREDMSDMVAEHQARAGDGVGCKGRMLTSGSGYRLKQQPSGRRRLISRSPRSLSSKRVRL